MKNYISFSKRTLISGIIAVGFLFSLTLATLIYAEGEIVTVCVSRTGTMRFLESGNCRTGEKKVSWNTQGVKGDQGEQGLPGEQGIHGLVGPMGDVGEKG